MAKSPEILILATQYYVECQMSVAQIAKRLNVSEKTLHTWKKENDWQGKRNRFLKSMYSTNQSLYELLHLVSQKAIDDYKTDGTMPDQKTLYFIMGMTDRLPKLKMYEKQEIQEKVEELNATNNEKENKINTDDMLQKFFNAITG
ncbi:MAG: transposase [Candidatus Gastranaerophilaceae bacterium]